MFEGASSFTSDVSAWDVSSVDNMNAMFSGAENFTSDVSAWDVSSVRDMNSMFAGATNFNIDVSAWDVSSVEDMQAMFYAATSFAQDLCWEINPTTQRLSMFGAGSPGSFSAGCRKVWPASSVDEDGPAPPAGAPEPTAGPPAPWRALAARTPATPPCLGPRRRTNARSVRFGVVRPLGGVNPPRSLAAVQVGR